MAILRYHSTMKTPTIPSITVTTEQRSIPIREDCFWKARMQGRGSEAEAMFEATYPQTLDQYTVMGIQLQTPETPIWLRIISNTLYSKDTDKQYGLDGGTFNTSQIQGNNRAVYIVFDT